MRFFFIVFTTTSLFSLSLKAQTLPLWELGIASGYATLPYYRGSASSRDVIVPMPLSLYRGGQKPIQKKEKRLTLKPSFAIGIAVPEGGEFGVRRNMPRLDATLEYGVKLAAKLWKKPRQALLINMPLRVVSSVSYRSIETQGWVLAPYVQYTAVSNAKNGWELNVALGPQYGSKGFHSYYYDVGANYALDGRPAYTAKAGYSGSRLTVYAQKSFHRLWLSAFARYDELSGARFIDSPLIEKTNSLFAGFVVGWVFAKSPQNVEMSDALIRR